MKVLACLPWLLACICELCSANEAEKTPYKVISSYLGPAQDTCKSQAPRFPDIYRYPTLIKAGVGERLHRVGILTKSADLNLNIDAALEEVDLDADGICDIVVTVSDPIGSGGDADVLSTVYLARNHHWLRIGAKSAKKDIPTDLDVGKFPEDADFSFSEFIALRQISSNKSYFVAWSHERIANGFGGYKVFELDFSGRLIVLNNWNGVGAQIYQWFKTLRGPAGNLVFDPDIERWHRETGQRVK